MARSCATRLAARRLRRQRSLSAAMVAAFAPCGGGGEARKDLGNAPLGGKVGYQYHDGEEGVFGGDVPAARPAGGAGLARVLWRQIVRKVMSSRSGSSVKEQYGHEEYAQNFDEGAAAEDPENLPRSFSARYARQRPAGLVLPDVAHRGSHGHASDGTSFNGG